jgi:TonB family protein
MIRAVAIAGLLGLATISVPAAEQSEPVLLSRNFPRFTAEMLNKGQSGYVLLQFRLDDEGGTYDHRIVISDPKGAFDETVVSFARKRLRFKVPAEWVESHADRNYEMAFLFLIESCAKVDLFPGITTIITTVRRRGSGFKDCDENSLPAPSGAEPVATGQRSAD